MKKLRLQRFCCDVSLDLLPVFEQMRKHQMNTVLLLFFTKKMLYDIIKDKTVAVHEMHLINSKIELSLVEMR